MTSRVAWGSRVAAQLRRVAPSAAVVVASAAREIAKQSGRAAGAGAVLDGAHGVLTALDGMQREGWSRELAVRHVVAEVGTGAASSAAGVLALAGLVAVGGPVALPSLLIVGVGSAMVTKRGLRALVRPHVGYPEPAEASSTDGAACDPSPRSGGRS